MSTTPVTIKDIARLLNLSKSTVSRALKNHPDISASTKEAVALLAEKLNYRPNEVAMSLRHRKSRIIGLVVPQISFFFFPSVIRGVEDVASKHGYKLMILQSDEQFLREVEACNVLMSANVEGVLASVSMTSTDFDHFRSIVQTGLPVVFFDRVPESFNADKVLLDDKQGAYRAVDYLIAQGCQRVAICLGNPNLLISKNRLMGYQEALVAGGVEVDDSLIIRGDTLEEVEDAALKLFSTNSRPDAIFAISDLTMSGIMKALYKLKVKIPEEVSVIGFCEEPFSTMYNPPVTSIKPMGFEIGKAAAELLFRRIADNDPFSSPVRIDLPAELIVREST
ncbi:MAG: LacI family DNA-binding transcriptional regulator [Bacteroidales bacterium]|nr:LacI family DNA-binding transcriptional regulator [Bacteroidales bacterium]